MPRVQNKRGTSANLASVNPTPLAGELFYDSTENAIKVGDGTTAYTSLEYVTATPRSHAHDDRYYTETEVDGLLAGKAAASHTHAFSQISDITFTDPLQDNSIVRYTSGGGWGVANSIGTIGVGSQPIGGWPAGSVGASLAGKVDDNDARLSDARTPTAHKSSHATGGSDALTPSDIGAAPLASPTFTGTVTNSGLMRWEYPDKSLDAAVSDLGYLRVYDESGAAAGLGVSTSSFNVGTQGAINLRFVTNTAERAIITTAGYVGIGTSSPSSLLHVNGVITVAATSGSAGSYLPSVCISGDANTGFGQVSGQSDTASVFTAGQERVRVDASGKIALNGGTASNAEFFVRGTMSSPSTRYGVFAQPTISASSSSQVIAMSSGAIMEAGATTSTVVCLNATPTTLGAGATVTNQYGLFVGSGFTQGANNYAALLGIPNGDNRWNLYASGSAPNYFAGNVGIGRTAPASALDVNGVITVAAGSGSAGSYLPAVVFSGDPNTGIQQIGGADTFSAVTGGAERLRVRADGNVAIGSTGFATARQSIGGSVTQVGGAMPANLYIHSAMSADSGQATKNAWSVWSAATPAASQAFTNFGHFYVSQGVAADTINHYGFFASVTGATNNYAFFAANGLAAGVNRWNFFATGNAPNYFAGNVGIGASRTSPSSALDVNGTIRATSLTDGTTTKTITEVLAGGAVTDGSITTAKLANDAVTYAKLQNVSATDRILGRSSAGAGDVEEITCTAFGRSLIDGANATAARGTLGAAPTENATFTGTTTFNGPVTEGYVPGGNTGTAKTIALTNGTVQDYTLTGNCTFTMPGVAAGQSFTLMLRTGAGSYTATFTGVKWPGDSPPTVTTTANRMDLFTFVSDGTNWYGSASQNYYV